MKKCIQITPVLFSLLLSACALTPQQQATRQAQQLKAHHALSVALAKQCDVETAELMAQLL